jgi:hypothetical protein
MKKLVLFLLMTALSVFSVNAREKQTWDDQKYKYEVRVGWGMPSETPVSAYYANPAYSDGGRLSSIYSSVVDGLYSTGGFTAELGLNFRKWFTLAFQTSFTGVWNDVYDHNKADVLYRDRGVVFNIAPQVRFNWVKRPVFRMYSSVGVGLTLVSYGKLNAIEPSLQFVPLGMAAGKDVFFFAEVGGGNSTNFLGYHVGLGYRF